MVGGGQRCGRYSLPASSVGESVLLLLFEKPPANKEEAGGLSFAPAASGRPAMAASGRSLEVAAGDGSPRKWSVSLREDVFAAFLAGDDGGAAARRVFAEGSLFSPLLFGSFFDPADAFPLWDFDPDAILAGGRRVGWSETAAEYVLTAALPEAARVDLAVAVEKGRVVEISGRWRRRRRREEDSGERSDWRAGAWWELGFVRRLELPEDARPAATAAAVDGGGLLEIRIPRRSSSPETGGADGSAAEP